MNNKRILLWAPFGSGKHYWGPGISAYRLYSLGLPNGYKVDLAHGFINQNDSSGIFENTYLISNINKFGIVGKLVFFIKSWLFIKNNYKKYDVVHCLGAFEYSFRPALWFQKRGVNSYCKITDEKGGLQGHSKLSVILGISEARKKRLNDIAGYIAISSEIVLILKKSGVLEEKIHTIPNGVNIDNFFPVQNFYKKIELRNKYYINKDKIVGLFVGGISRRKQPMELVKILHAIVEKHSKNFLLILLGPDRSGDDNELNNILKYISDNNLEDNCIHFDHTDNPLDFYQLSDFFLLPSLSEGMSNAVLEALSCGLPSIVTPVSGMRDMVKDGYNGFVCELNEFQSKIINCIENVNNLHELSVNSRSKIINDFASNKILELHLKLFFGDK